MHKKVVIVSVILVLLLLGIFFSFRSQIGNSSTEHVAQIQFVSSDKDVVDFNHDGINELLAHAGFNEPLYHVVPAGVQETDVNILMTRDEDGRERPLLIGHSSDALGRVINDIFFIDLDGNGADEVIDVVGGVDGETGIFAADRIGVFVWNGTLFEYSKSLSEQLQATFNPSEYPFDTIPIFY